MNTSYQLPTAARPPEGGLPATQVKKTGKSLLPTSITAESIQKKTTVVASLADIAKLLAAVPSMQDKIYQNCSY